MSSMKWGMVCSVEDYDLLPQLRSFGEWLVAELEAHSSRFYLNHLFEPTASFCLYCRPDDKADVYTAYEKIYREHSDVIYVIHILPKKNSLEFKLLKDLTINYALIGQGILVDKALSNFSDCALDTVLENMNQYISRRISQIVSYRRPENTYRLCIGGSKISLKPSYGVVTESNISKCVEMVLHSINDNLNIGNVVNHECPSPRPISAIAFCDEDVGRCSSCTVIVEGFPSSFNKFQLSALFSAPPFFPISVFISSSGKAFVDFSTKYHAAQAVIFYKTDKKRITGETESGISLSLKLADPVAQKFVVKIIESRQGLKNEFKSDKKHELIPKRNVLAQKN